MIKITDLQKNILNELGANVFPEYDNTDTIEQIIFRLAKSDTLKRREIKEKITENSESMTDVIRYDFVNFKNYSFKQHKEEATTLTYFRTLLKKQLHIIEYILLEEFKIRKREIISDKEYDDIFILISKINDISEKVEDIKIVFDDYLKNHQKVESANKQIPKNKNTKKISIKRKINDALNKIEQQIEKEFEKEFKKEIEKEVKYGGDNISFKFIIKW